MNVRWKITSILARAASGRETLPPRQKATVAPSPLAGLPAVIGGDAGDADAENDRSTAVSTRRYTICDYPACSGLILNWLSASEHHCRQRR